MRVIFNGKRNDSKRKKKYSAASLFLYTVNEASWAEKKNEDIYF